MRNDRRLTKRASEMIRNPENQIVISAVVSWEIAIKTSVGKIKPASIVVDVQDLIASQTFEALPITVEHTVRTGLLPLHHRDPFDRMLIAQAQIEGLAVISGDAAFDPYEVYRIW